MYAQNRTLRILCVCLLALALGACATTGERSESEAVTTSTWIPMGYRSNK